MTERGLRLFVALELPEDVREVLEAWGRAVAEQGGPGLRPVAEQGGPGLRPVPAGSLHVTLCFLGRVEPDQAPAVAGACEAARSSSVGELRISRGLWLPRRRPRVLAVELEDPDARLSSLQAGLARALSAIGVFAPESRAFLPHVTVARVGRDVGRTPGVPRRAGELPAPPAARFTAQRIVLYRSHLGAGPARYEALHQVPLSQG